MAKLPVEVSARLAAIGKVVYGPQCWRGRLAAGLGVSQSTLRLWLGGEYKSQRDIDGELIQLIDRERDASAERSVELGDLRKAIVKSSDRSRHDAL